MSMVVARFSSKLVPVLIIRILCAQEYGMWIEARELLDQYRHMVVAERMKGGHRRKHDHNINDTDESNLTIRCEAYNMVIGACEVAGQALEAMKVFEMMVADGVRPSTSTMAVVIQALQKGGHWMKAMDLYHSMPRWMRRQNENLEF